MHADNTFSVKVRRFLMLLLLLGLAGLGAELLLTDHTEDAWQLVPVVLIGSAFAVLLAHAATARSTPGQTRGAIPLRALQAVMFLFIASGFLGTGLHMQGKMEFKQESDPSLSGWRLLLASLESKSPPPLAPGVMIHLGLIGLAYTFRHPLLSPRAAPAPPADRINV